MEDGKQLIEFGPAERDTAGVKDMEVDKKEREKRKSTEFEKRETTSEDDESSQNKRRSGEGSKKSVPADPGKRRTSSKGCYGKINYPNRNDPSTETPKAFPTHDTTTENKPASSPTTNNTNKEQTTINSLLPDDQQHQQHTGTHARTHHQPRRDSPQQ